MREPTTGAPPHNPSRPPIRLDTPAVRTITIAKMSARPQKIEALDWSGRQDSNLRPPGPEPELEEFHAVTSGGTGEQPVENRGDPDTPASDTVAPNGYGETPFGAPVVRDLPPDPGPHERLLTVREVAASLRVSTALVYKLCERNELRSLRIGGALRFYEADLESFLVKLEGTIRR